MANTSSYQPLPSSSPVSSRSNSPRESVQAREQDGYAPVRSAAHETDPSYRPLRRSVQDEFNRPSPSWWKRALLLCVLFGMGYISIWLGKKGLAGKDEPTIIYASRYSDEHKYRPASSPVITEYLPGNRIRLRGAQIGGVGIPEDKVPLTAAQKAAAEKKKRQEAKDKAREKMGLRVKKRKTLAEQREEGKDKVRELERKLKGLA